MKCQWLVCASLALGFSICSASSTKASEPFRVVAATGDLSGIGNSTFTAFGWGASFDSAGRINVRADILSTSGMWIDQPGGLMPALVSPGTAPGFPAGASIQGFSKFGAIALNGYAAAIGNVTGGVLTGNNTGLFVSGPDGTFRLAERSGQFAYNKPGVTVSPQGSLDVLSNRDGDLFVQGQFIGGPFFGAGTQAVWLERGLGPELAFYSGMPAPGFPAGVIMQSTISSKFGVAIDNDQRIAYGGFAGTSKGIWLFDPNAPVTHRLVARTEPATIVTTFSQLSDLQLTQNRVVFQGNVNVPGFSARNALLADTNGTLETIAKAGDLAPGLGPTDLFETGSTFPVERVAVNDQGDIAFAAGTLDSLVPNKRTTGIWLDTPAAVPQLVLQSSDLPGSSSFSSLQSLVMNDNGQMAFTLGSVTLSVWFYGPGLGVQRVAGEGDVLSLILNGQPVSRTIDDLQVGTFHVDKLAASNYLSESGQVVLQVRFREGGWAVMAWSPVPEPGVVASITVALVASSGIRRLRRDS